MCRNITNECMVAVVSDPAVLACTCSAETLLGDEGGLHAAAGTHPISSAGPSLPAPARTHRLSAGTYNVFAIY